METKITKGTNGNGAKPGERRGGKLPGVPNAHTRELWRELIKMGMGQTFDDPVLWMAKVYSGQIIPDASSSIRAFCADKVAQFIYPKLKSVEFKKAPDAPAAFDTTKLPAGTLESLHQVAILAEPVKDESVSN
jgi:hypothetical protein